MNKAALIGIGIAIIVAGIIGIYAFSIPQEGSSAIEPGIGIGEEVDVTTQEKEDIPAEESKISLKDKAEATIEEPEEEPNTAEIFVEEKLGMGEIQP